MRWSVVIVALGGFGCGGTIASADAGGPGATDAGSVDDAGDSAVEDAPTLPDGFDADSCYGDTLILGQTCDAELDALCAGWARDRAYGGIGYSKCVVVDGLAQCSLGTYCTTENDCRCSETLICPNGDVCYQASVETPAACKPPCTP